MDTRFGYVFPAIRGIQAGREYYVSMCPLRLIPKIFYFDEDEAQLSPELRAQRTLNKARVPEMARYIQDSREGYVFSALTSSVDAEVKFEPMGSSGEESRVGKLRIPMDAKFIINDGQHRRAAIELALREKPALGDESIAVVFFLDRGLERCQQMFADLNRYAIRPSKSLGVLYDHRDNRAMVARLVVLQSSIFKDLVETEKTSLSPRSRKLFTLSAIFSATSALLGKSALNDPKKAADIATDYWEKVAKQIPEWRLVRDRKITAGEVRQDFIHSHGIGLQAIGVAGNALIQKPKSDWKKRLKSLRKINWSRSNGKVWEGRAMIGGRVSKASQNVVLATNVIKKALRLKLSEEEKKAEEAFRMSGNGRR
jgi:DNA sulfur modification protein DndB